MVQLSKKPLTAVEFVAPLAKIEPIYKEEEEAFKVVLFFFALTHYSPVLLIYTPPLPSPENRKPLGFLMFSRGIDKQHRAVMR